METNENFAAQILSNLKLSALNEMQIAATDACTQNNDVVILSPTGSGKTIAFLLSIISKLDKANKNVQALVIVPSRELALQIDEVFKKMATGYKITCCYGGHKREIEENNLIQPPALIVGTAGRLADHLRRNNFSVNHITTLVLDEFDKSLELGFQEEMAAIIKTLPAVKNRILTSATRADYLPDFLGVSAPFYVDFLGNTIEKKHIADEVIIQTLASDDKDKSATLTSFLSFIDNKSAIVFCNHRDAVERTNTILKENGLVSVFYHGGMEQQERESAMCKFKNGTSNILITTDLASRGLDIPDIKYIIHYHLPATEDVNTHRNGRTGRMFSGGKIVYILSADEMLPTYITEQAFPLSLPEQIALPDKPTWSTLFIAAGKKDKVNKIDIVGFLHNNATLKKEDIGLIEVKDFYAFAAVRKLKIGSVVELVKDKKIKNKKVKIEVAK